MVTKEQLDDYLKAYQEGNPLISDEEYDRLLEEYLKENGENNRPFLRSQQSDDVNDVVGTLPKVYGVETPMREGQKTYGGWIETKKLSRVDLIRVQPKFDGCSVALDVTSGRLFTRGDYDNGESVDVTDLFKSQRDHMDIDPMTTAIKFEAIMAHEVFESFGLDKKYARPRDAVAGAMTSRDVELTSLITLVPLREYRNGRQYIPNSLKDISVGCDADDFETINGFIDNKLSDGAIVKYGDCHYSIDGVVVSVIDEDTGSTISDKEVAIKILNNIMETRIIGIDYQYGRTGKITPVGILEPVKFGNVTVDHVGLSTFDRIMELKLNYNDTVRIVYNIVPYLLSSYHDGSYPIPIPSMCPICGSELNLRTLKTVRCTNPQCKGLKIGLVTRYCEKMKMLGLSKGTITILFENGLIDRIGDLYRLTPEKIMSVNGFREKRANNICDTIKKASKLVPLSRWLGALPIKDISAKTWQLIIDSKFPMDMMKAVNTIQHNIQSGTVESFMEECVPEYVYGFSVNTYMGIKEGLTSYWDDIVDVCQYVSFYCLTDMTKPTKGRITLTGTRDDKLISYLKEKGYDVNDFSSKTMALVIPYKEYVSSKVAKAINMGIPIYTIEEAYEALK